MTAAAPVMTPAVLLMPSATARSVEVLRDDVVPATVGKLHGADVAVTGMTASSKDFLDTMKSHLPIVFL